MGLLFVCSLKGVDALEMRTAHPGARQETLPGRLPFVPGQGIRILTACTVQVPVLAAGGGSVIVSAVSDAGRGVAAQD